MIGHMLGHAVDVLLNRKGRKIWDSGETVRHFEKTWYEDPARLKVYDIIESIYEPQAKLLDGGCGVGFDTERILKRFEHIDYTGLDSSPKMIKRCWSKFADYTNAEFVEGSIYDLHYDDYHFDIVISCNVMVHIPNFTMALSELCRVCRRHLILQFNYINDKGEYLSGMAIEDFDKRFLDKKSKMYFVYYNPQEIADLCFKFGLEEVSRSRFYLDKFKRDAVVMHFRRK